MEEIIKRNLHALSMDLGLISTAQDDAELFEKYEYYIDREIANLIQAKEELKVIKEELKVIEAMFEQFKKESV